MKSLVLLAGMLAMILMVTPASAALILDFGTGDAGAGGTITSTGLHTGSGSGIAIDTLTVTNGSSVITYDVDGTVNGTSETGVGSLDYNTTGNTFTITGSIVCDGNPSEATGPCAGHAAGFVLVANTTLVLGTGTLSITNDTTSIASEDSVSFSAQADDKSSALLAALGLSADCVADTAHTGFCQGWTHGGFTIGSQIGTGNTYTAFSTDIPNTFTGVPEPSSILLLGTVMVGIAQVVRRRMVKA